MRWTCSHCGDSQFLAEEVIGTGWFFSKCPVCAGHSLVKKLEVTVIKVNSAPPGETILHPESRSRQALLKQGFTHLAPTPSLLSQKTTDQLFNLSANSSTKKLSALTPPPFRESNANVASSPPSPLQSFSAQQGSRKVLPLLFNLAIIFGMILSLALISGSGYFFYREYQARLHGVGQDRIESTQASPYRSEDHGNGSQR